MLTVDTLTSLLSTVPKEYVKPFEKATRTFVKSAVTAIGSRADMDEVDKHRLVRVAFDLVSSFFTIQHPDSTTCHSALVEANAGDLSYLRYKRIFDIMKLRIFSK